MDQSHKDHEMLKKMLEQKDLDREAMIKENEKIRRDAEARAAKAESRAA